MFTIQFTTDNAAFDGDGTEEIVRILRDLANRAAYLPGTSGNIRDSNGNTIGTFNLT